MNQITPAAILAFFLTQPTFAQDCAPADQPDIVETAIAAGSFKTLATALEKAGLVSALKGKGPFTVFAPTDAAFEQLPKGTLASLLKPKNRAQLQGILTFHVVPGKLPASQVVTNAGLVTLNGQRVQVATSKDGASIGGARIVKTDIHCSNGVIHVIDSVITPVQADIVEVATRAGSFQTLLAAAKAAGLVGTLKGKGPFTIFAPSDEAFARLPKGTVASLLEPANKARLVEILTYHVVAGRKFAADVVAAGSLPSLQGADITVHAGKKHVKVSGAKVTATDLNASNGVIHVIDSVIMPPVKAAR